MADFSYGCHPSAVVVREAVMRSDDRWLKRAVIGFLKLTHYQIPGSVDPNRHKMYLDLMVAQKAREMAAQTLFSVATDSQ